MDEVDDVDELGPVDWIVIEFPGETGETTAGNVAAEPVGRKALCRATNLRLSAAEPISSQ